jgi:hypothetical protein
MMKKHAIIIVLLVSTGLLNGFPVQAAEMSLTSHPAKCVSLKQGNICYQEIQMLWQASEVGDYCLYNREQTEPLKCWQGMDHAEYNFEFNYPDSQQYVMRESHAQDDLATTSIEVKWVYKARRNQFSWRVF